jgi:2'-5' RNA ligase
MQQNHSRYFIGLDLSVTDKLAIAKWRDKQLFGLTDKPVPVENFHITLSFLGQVKPNKMEQLETLLDEIATKYINTQTVNLAYLPKQKYYI